MSSFFIFLKSENGSCPVQYTAAKDIKIQILFFTLEAQKLSRSQAGLDARSDS